MSRTYSLVCEETKSCLWVGQGHGEMTVFYSGEPQTMERLGRFLRAHVGKQLALMDSEKAYAEIDDLTQFEDLEDDE